MIADGGFEDRCRISCGNALDHSYDDATCFFLYLVPRGLKLVFKEIIEKLLMQGKPLRIVTYMSPIPTESLSPCQVFKISTASHPDAMWPLYFYDIDTDSYNRADHGSHAASTES